MKITIEKKGPIISVNVKAPEGVRRSDVAETISIALASSVASIIPSDAPIQLRRKIGLSLADEVANAVKQNFLDVTMGTAGKAAIFTEKEADFIAALNGMNTGEQK